MNYTIQVNKVTEKDYLKAFANITFENAFKISSIAILESSKGSLYVAMPKMKTGDKDENGKNIYQDVCHPCTKEFREQLNSTILGMFNNDEKERSVSIDTPFTYKTAVSEIDQPDSNIKGTTKITLADRFVIHGVSILENKKGDIFVGMPNYKKNEIDEKGKDAYQDICYPVTKEFRTKLYEEILGKYENVKEKNRVQQEQQMNHTNRTKR